MTEIFQGQTLLLASSNQGKIQELTKRLAPLGIDLKSAADIPIDPPEETAPDFLGNALIKAQAYCEASGLPTLADDSGLMIPSLGGYPGIYAGRVAEEAGGYQAFFPILQKKLEDAQADAKAYHVCTLVFMIPEGRYWVFEGTVHGKLVFPPRGTEGFGYDPIFLPDGSTKTFSEDQAYKSKVSHRAQAMDKFVNALFKGFDAIE